jgi:hypothetical protein
MQLKRLFLLFTAVFLISQAKAQLFKSGGSKLFKAVRDTLVLDSLSLVPGSIYFKTFPDLDSASQPQIDYRYHALIFRKKRPDSMLVTYRRFPFNFEKKYYHKDVSQIYRDLSRPGNPYMITYTNTTRQDYLFQNDGLSKNGNISRGITFGNTQDVVVNSNLNLQVSGKLTPEIDMVMAATDNNIPFQADGTTAQLQEFDKVYIQLNNASTKMIVGDYQLSRPQNSYFMSFYKRAQGIYLENNYVDSTNKKPLLFKTQLSGAVSRGKFSRQVFFGTENNQGPYRLKGADNEPFIIVLSGTERIYIDGKLLQRGQENDYIIDYNSGELTFTAKQIITKDKRIVAEFQYAERNYGRSLFLFSEEISGKKGKMFLNMFSEQDNKDRPLQQQLDQSMINVMRQVGDTLDKAYYTGVAHAAFNNSDVFYMRVDTVVNGVLYPNVYVHSTNPDTAHYTLKCSIVGAGKGNYIQVSSPANGRVYQWVAPINGLPQGNYEPVIPLVTPKQNQMLTGGFAYSLTANHSLGAEGVYTKNDVNRFSSADKGNDEAGGVKVNSKNQMILSSDSSGKKRTKLIYNLNYEYIQKQFHQIERFRSIEFERDWNRPLDAGIINDQNIGNAEIGIVRSNGQQLTYGYNTFVEGSNYEGKKHDANGRYFYKGFNAGYVGSYLQSQDKLNLQNTEFYRHKGLVSQNIKKLKLSYNDVFEHNIFKNSLDGKLLPRAYQFWEWEGSVSNTDSAKTKIKVFYRERRDKLNYGNVLKDSTYAKNTGIQSSIYSIRNNPITLVLTYRELELRNVVGTSLKPDNTLLSRLEYNPRYLKGFITMGLYYETGYGLENKKEYYYQEVAPGLGQYAWLDYNENGIKELNEFEIAQFSDQARYIRIYIPTNNYVKVLQNLLSLSLNVRPASLVKKPRKAIARFVNRWMLQTAFRSDNKTYDDKHINNFNPLLHVNDSLLIASNKNLRQSVFFNQSSAVFGADYTYTDNHSKQLLVNGIEERLLLSHEGRIRINFLKSWSINSTNLYSQKGYNSQFLKTRNYLIEGYETEERLAFQPNTAFRLSGIYKYGRKSNIIEGGFQKALTNNYGLELKYNQTEKGSLTGRMDIIIINFNDDSNSPVAYEMLNALSKGQNYTWELSFQRNLNSNLQVSINYNGRKTPTAPAVHIGGAQIRAFF